MPFIFCHQVKHLPIGLSLVPGATAGSSGCAQAFFQFVRLDSLLHNDTASSTDSELYPWPAEPARLGFYWPHLSLESRLLVVAAYTRPARTKRAVIVCLRKGTNFSSIVKPKDRNKFFATETLSESASRNKRPSTENHRRAKVDDVGTATHTNGVHEDGVASGTNCGSPRAPHKSRWWNHAPCIQHRSRFSNYHDCELPVHALPRGSADRHSKEHPLQPVPASSASRRS